MKRKKRYLRYKKERVVLSDVLPYELPITFSNRFFYDFLLENRIQFNEKCISWKKQDETLDLIIKLLFGAEENAEIETTKEKLFGKDIETNRFKTLKPKGKPPVEPATSASIPFSYLISHKENEYRELKICHPRHQIQMVNFYDQFKELILYYSSNSEFSIRKPSKIAKFVYHKDKTHYDSLSNDAASIEEDQKEYENLRSFFVYKDYSNIYKFYESYKYHRCEKKYNKLIKLDISKCFNSIYTHSLAWALLSKESVKENLGPSKQTFSGNFDRLMQSLNYNETNGIIIGPEFSRIFAELILQSVDQDVASILRKEQYNYRHRADYEVFRYVDDYFIFYNDEETKEVVLQALQLKLKEYKLYLNSAKAISYEKPIITEISMAKHKIARLLEEKIGYQIEKFEVTEKDKSGEDKVVAHKKGQINVNSNALITKFKTIIKEYNVDYKDLLNYSLAIIERKSVKLIKDYHSIIKNENSERLLIKAILEILDYTFFVYSVAPKVNTTIKLCRILRIYNAFLKRKGGNLDFKHIIFKRIYDDICFILKKNKNTEHTQVETLYLLIALSELGKEYWLDMQLLCSYFDIDLDEESPKFPNLNYLSIVVLLFYMKDKKRYIPLREYLEKMILAKFKNKGTMLQKDTELILLLFDSLTCPYITLETKKSLLTNFGIEDQDTQEKIISYEPSQYGHYWFTKWTDFNFGKELDAKQSQEVY